MSSLQSGVLTLDLSKIFFQSSLLLLVPVVDLLSVTLCLALPLVYQLCSKPSPHILRSLKLTCLFFFLNSVSSMTWFFLFLSLLLGLSMVVIAFSFKITMLLFSSLSVDSLITTHVFTYEWSLFNSEGSSVLHLPTIALYHRYPLIRKIMSKNGQIILSARKN